MKLYAPKYYRRFRCIADRCEHNCCTDWEIDIDSETLQKYKALEGGYGDAVKDSISMDGTRRVRRVSHTSARRRYAPLTRRSICLRLDMALRARYALPNGQREISNNKRRYRHSLPQATYRISSKARNISNGRNATIYRVAKQHIDTP